VTDDFRTQGIGCLFGTLVCLIVAAYWAGRAWGWW
jgi:hypothetical protein